MLNSRIPFKGKRQAFAFENGFWEKNIIGHVAEILLYILGVALRGFCNGANQPEFWQPDC